MASATRTQGSKGSDVYTSTADERVDLSISIVRGANPVDIVMRTQRVAATHLADAFVLAFHSRNVRGGKGERNIFYTMLQALHADHPELTRDLLDLIPHYGCWRDVFALVDMFVVKNPERAAGLEPLRSRLLDIAARQLQADEETPVEPGKSISLCAKWAPREASSRDHRLTAQDLATRLFPNHMVYSARMRAYRKLIADLNRRLNTVETLMCADRWDEIKPPTVPGRAGKLYKRAFLNLAKRKEDDSVRVADNKKRAICAANFRAHYEKAKQGKATVHGADTLFPHEIVKEAHGICGAALSMRDSIEHFVEGTTPTLGTDDERNHLSAVWRSLVTKTRAAGGLGRAVMMSDFSGSMQSAGAAGDTPYWVSMALGILGSQVATGAFRGKMMTFDSNPAWHQFPTPDDTPADLFDCLRTLNQHISQGTSTDFQAAMDLILATLKSNRVRPGEEPETLIVLTDMNWDQATASNGVGAYTGHPYRHHVKTAPWQTHLEMIQESFRRAGEDMWGPGQGYTVPRIIVWNLAANPTDIHATADTPGVGFLSGWSATQFKVIQAEGPRQLTPLELLRTELDDPQYDRVRERVATFIAAHEANHANGWGAVDSA